MIAINIAYSEQAGACGGAAATQSARPAPRHARRVGAMDGSKRPSATGKTASASAGPASGSGRPMRSARARRPVAYAELDDDTDLATDPQAQEEEEEPALPAEPDGSAESDSDAKGGSDAGEDSTGVAGSSADGSADLSAPPPRGRRSSRQPRRTPVPVQRALGVGSNVDEEDEEEQVPSSSGRQASLGGGGDEGESQRPAAAACEPPGKLGVCWLPAQCYGGRGRWRTACRLRPGML